MTNINKSDLTKHPRASDSNLTAGEPPRAPAVIAAGLERSSQKSQFAEHLAAQPPKAGVMARSVAPEAQPQAPRANASLKMPPSPPEHAAPRIPSKSQQEHAAPRIPSKSQPRRPLTEPTQAPWNRAAPPTRIADDRQTVNPASSRINEGRMAAPIAFQDSSKPLGHDLSYASENTLEPTRDTAKIIDAAAGTGSSLTSVTSKEELEDWQLRLQQMLATGNPELFMQQSPALALLAGHLELIEPAQIPALVAQSPLLQSILSQAQTSDVLQSAMPLEQNLQMLGLVTSAKNAGPLSASAVQGQPLVTLGETLEALGFDTKRIIQEGDLLKENLGLEGLQSYMQRAERLQSSLGLPVAWPILPQDAFAMPAVQKPGASALDPALMAQLSRLSPQNQGPLETIQLGGQAPERPDLMPLTVLDDGGSPLLIPTMEGATESWDPFGVTMELKADPALPTPPAMDEVPLVMNALPRVAIAAQDPFMAMAGRWNTETLQTLRPEDFLSRESMDFASDPKAAAAQPLRSLDELLNSQFIQAPDFNNRMDASFSPGSEGSSLDGNAIQLSLQDLAGASDDSGGDASGRDQNPSFMNQDASALMAPGQGPAASNKTFSLETAAAQSPSAPVSHQQLQDILDKSSMLIKDGGGSIRLDLGSKEMGPLDLALDIKDKTVELRIIAHSDQAREALLQELPKLRESLQNQNLQLEKVEIGVSYGSAWSQSSGNGQQNREQFFENSSESNSRGPGGIRSSARSYRQSLVSAPEARVPLHNGLIQVRV